MSDIANRMKQDTSFEQFEKLYKFLKKSKKENRWVVSESRIEPTFQNWSGRRELNPRPKRWQRFALPLSYSRLAKKLLYKIFFYGQ